MPTANKARFVIADKQGPFPPADVLLCCTVLLPRAALGSFKACSWFQPEPWTSNSIGRPPSLSAPGHPPCMLHGLAVPSAAVPSSHLDQTVCRCPAHQQQPSGQWTPAAAAAAAAAADDIGLPMLCCQQLPKACQPLNPLDAFSSNMTVGWPCDRECLSPAPSYDSATAPTRVVPTHPPTHPPPHLWQFGRLLFPVSLWVCQQEST
jgi:hypothetical protein